MNRLSLRGAAALLVLAVLSTQAQTRQLSSSERDLLERLAMAEARGEGKLGMALVTRSVLNRVALVGTRQVLPSTYMARGRSVSHIVRARNQYQPVRTGAINGRRTSSQRRQAREAVFLAQDTAKLNQELSAVGVSQNARRRLINATGFRAGSAFNDSSQNHNRQVFRRHIFNSDRFARRLNVMQAYVRYWGGAGAGETLASTSEAPLDLGRGAKGDDVRRLQQALNKHGARLAVDGDFGPATERALQAFQRANQLSPSGRLDGDTIRSLAGRPPGPRIPIGLARGMRGPSVRALQQALNRDGARLSVDGDFGGLTDRALRDFQRANELQTTGRIDRATLAKLEALQAGRVP